MKNGPKPKTIAQAVEKIRSLSIRLDNGCLVYLKGKSIGIGYRVTRAENKEWYNHRLVFYHENGYLPEVVRHSCDNPPCIEKEHLLGGTHGDNVADKIARGRMPRGSQRPESVLNEQMVKEIFENPSIDYTMLGQAYKISRGAIHNIKSGRTWNHVTKLPKKK